MPSRYCTLFFSLIVPLATLTGCNTKDRAMEEQDLAVKEECRPQAISLKDLCQEDNIGSLSIENLLQCHHWQSFPDELLTSCDVPPTNDFAVNQVLRNMFASTPFAKEFNRRCITTKIGDLTLQEFQYCTESVPFMPSSLFGNKAPDFIE
jgi:hypothetical protein